MQAQNVSRPAPAVAVNEPLGDLRCLLGGRLSDSKPTENSQGFIDRYGHRHSDAVLRNWSPAAIRAMGIRPIEEGGAR
jgi:hypothetical protein